MRTQEPWAQGGLGPFYKRGAPDKGDGLPGYMFDSSYTGDLLKLEINVQDTTGHYVYGSTIEIWHCDENGVYDMDGYKYRAIWHVAGIHSGIDVTTVLPGIATYEGRQIYRHVHLSVTPPSESGPWFNWNGELKLVMPPWTDTPDEIGPVDDPREITDLVGPRTGGFGPNTWYRAKATIVLENVNDGVPPP